MKKNVFFVQLFNLNIPFFFFLNPSLSQVYAIILEFLATLGVLHKVLFNIFKLFSHLC